MYIAKNEDLIILAKDTREELERGLVCMVYTSIEETEVEYELYNGEYLTLEEIEAKERERIGELTLTATDVERAIHKAKGMDFEDLIEFVKNSGYTGIDIKSLKIELKANNFYRKHPYIDAIGMILGYTSEDMDYLFEHKELPST